MLPVCQRSSSSQISVTVSPAAAGHHCLQDRIVIIVHGGLYRLIIFGL